jgi:hypothetical protein
MRFALRCAGVTTLLHGQERALQLHHHAGKPLLAHRVLSAKKLLEVHGPGGGQSLCVASQEQGQGAASCPYVCVACDCSLCAVLDVVFLRVSGLAMQL